jgi:hypothetical protein
MSEPAGVETPIGNTCGASMIEDADPCSRPAAHYPTTNHRQWSPNGDGSWVEFYESDDGQRYIRFAEGGPAFGVLPYPVCLCGHRFDRHRDQNDPRGGGCWEQPCRCMGYAPDRNHPSHVCGYGVNRKLLAERDAFRAERNSALDEGRELKQRLVQEQRERGRVEAELEREQRIVTSQQQGSVRQTEALRALVAENDELHAESEALRLLVRKAQRGGHIPPEWERQVAEAIRWEPTRR